MIAEILTKLIISKKVKTDYKNIVFKYNKFGKPILDDNIGILFNISHSGEWVVVAVDNQLVGIDIEKIRVLNLDNMIKTVFSTSEIKDFEKINYNDLIRYFYDV